MFRSKRRIKRAHMPEIMLTPLIDTFCVLLIIFIVAAPMAQNGIRVDLPHGKTREGNSTQDLVVSIAYDKQTHENKIYFNSYPVERNELASTVQRALAQNNEEVPVYVRADRTISYGEVISVVDELKQVGVRYVAMATQPT